MPYLSEGRMRRIARLASSVPIPPLAGSSARRPKVFAVPHVAPWITIAWLKVLSRRNDFEFGVFFEPTPNQAINRTFIATYQRFGVQPLAGSQGALEALRILRAGGCIGVFFDQDASENGYLTSFLGRLCSTTQLPAYLALHAKADLYVVYPQRRGFWNVCIEAEEVPPTSAVSESTIALNLWLEEALRARLLLREAWYWTYDRWKYPHEPQRCFRSLASRSWLATELRMRGLAHLPRVTGVGVTLPRDLKGLLEAVLVVLALRQARPDFRLLLSACHRYLPLLEKIGIADALQPSPEGLRTVSLSWRARAFRADIWVLLTREHGADWHALMSGASLRFGAVAPDEERPLLTHVFRLPKSTADTHPTTLAVGEALLARFGYSTPLERSPLSLYLSTAREGVAVYRAAGAEEEGENLLWKNLAESLAGLETRHAPQPGVWYVLRGSDLTEHRRAQEFVELARAVSSVTELITNDAEVASIASAFGTPVLALSTHAADSEIVAAVRSFSIRSKRVALSPQIGDTTAAGAPSLRSQDRSAAAESHQH